MKFFRIMILSAVLFCLVSTSVWAFGGGGAVRVGNMAPDFSLQDSEGNMVTLSDLRGKVVFLNFWATWCPPCRTEMPSMEMLNEVFSGSDFIMLAVNVEPEGLTTVPPFLERNPHTFTILYDLEAEAQNAYGVFRFPETFLIDKEGRVARHYIGAYNWATVEIMSQVKELIESQKP